MGGCGRHTAVVATLWPRSVSTRPRHSAGGGVDDDRVARRQCRREVMRVGLLAVIMAAEALQLSDTYHRLLEAVPKPMPLISPLPMVYHSKFTPAHVAMRPDCAAQVRSSDSLFSAPATPEERPRRRAVLASVWLGLGMLDECHELVTPESYSGSDSAYLHALLHRREGPNVGEVSMTGFDNSRYWFGVLGAHETFRDVRHAAAGVSRDASPLVDAFLDGLGETWDPFRFVSLCEAAVDHADEAAAAYCRAVQQDEWDLLHARIVASLNG